MAFGILDDKKYSVLDVGAIIDQSTGRESIKLLPQVLRQNWMYTYLSGVTSQHNMTLLVASTILPSPPHPHCKLKDSKAQEEGGGLSTFISDQILLPSTRSSSCASRIDTGGEFADNIFQKQLPLFENPSF